MATRKKVEKLLAKVRATGRTPTLELEQRFYELTDAQAFTVDRRLQNQINALRRTENPTSRTHTPMTSEQWREYFENPPYAPDHILF